MTLDLRLLRLKYQEAKAIEDYCQHDDVELTVELMRQHEDIIAEWKFAAWFAFPDLLDRIEELEARVEALEKELEWDHDYQSVPRRTLEAKE